VIDQVQILVIEDVQITQPPEIGGAGPAIGAVDAIALRKEQLGQVSAVLPGNSRYDCGFHSG